ncbi:hypothetical protein [Sphingomonas sp. BAUL-RG-20F-R05-02]|uniref:hypothetical protein n=1 Tax=Sphingomonas sp. BAUL-RG-20F-R05-02 TaxID=2914830 RepID=UPI001F59EB1C|nr:hypothetical protein [Sphingomonas sp. BAUL-RG-20F-R05-02]
MRDLVEQMLTSFDIPLPTVIGSERRFRVAVGGQPIHFDTSRTAIGLSFEKLGAAIEARVSAERVSRMINSCGLASQPLPLWLVRGSDVLAAWLAWAGAANALRKVLTLTDKVGQAPVVGYLDRRARRELGQGGARIRVVGGTAVLERLELSGRPRCVASIGEIALVRIERHQLPETLMTALRQDPQRNALRPLADVVSHPFFAAAELMIEGISDEGSSVVFTVRSSWAPLEPVPDPAWAVLPSDADPVSPWRATASERRLLDRLIEEARERARATGGRR